MPFPTVIIEAAFGSNATSTNPTWTDITPYTEGDLHTTRGRQQELDDVTAGTASFSLDNADRRFDPTFLTGPYVSGGVSQVKPLVPVRMRANYAGTTYNVWRGFMDGWPQKYQDPKMARIDVTATDAFKVLALAKQPSTWEQWVVREVVPVHWWKLNDPAGTTVAKDYGSSPAHGTVSPSVDLGQPSIVPYSGQACMGFNATGASDRVSLAVGTSGVTTAAFTLECWFKFTGTASAVNESLLFEQYDVSTQKVGVVCAIYGTDGGADIGKIYVDVGNSVGGSNGKQSSIRVDDGLVHHMVYTVSGATHKMYIDGVDVTSGTGSADVGIPTPALTSIGWNDPGGYVQSSGWIGYLSDVLVFSSALSSVQVLQHYNAGANGLSGQLSGIRVVGLLDAIGWPANDRDIDTGVSLVQGNAVGSDTLDALKAVALAEDARLYMDDDGKVVFVGRANFQSETRFTTNQAILGDSGAQIQYEDSPEYEFNDQLIYNDARVARANGQVQIATDTASRDAYYPRSYSLTGLLNTTDADALGRAQAIVVTHKDPALRVRLVRLDGGSDDTRFPTMLGRKLGDRVTLVNTTPAGSVMSSDFIIEKIEHTVSDVRWTTDFYLSPASLASYWILGDAVYGKLDTTTRLSY